MTCRAYTMSSTYFSSAPCAKPGTHTVFLGNRRRRLCLWHLGEFQRTPEARRKAMFAERDRP